MIYLCKSVPRGTFYFTKKTYAHIIHNYLLIFPLILALFSLASILWATNKEIAIYRSVKLFEFVFLFYYVKHLFSNTKIFHLPEMTLAKKTPESNDSSQNLFHVEQFENTRINLTPLKCSTWNIFKTTISIFILSALLNSVIGISQFLLQKSIGLFWLKESIISPSMPGIAKILLNGQPYIRAYGLFPHPNVLGGYLVFSIILTILCSKLFHVEQLEISSKAGVEPLKKIKCSTWNIYIKTIAKRAIVTPARNATSRFLANLIDSIRSIVPRGTICKSFMAGGRGTLINTILAIQVLALLLTFSKSAIIGLFLGLIYLVTAHKYSNVPRGTFLQKIKCSTWNILKQNKTKIILSISILILFNFLIKPDLYSFFIKSLNERYIYLLYAFKLFLTNPLLGSGMGQFVLNISNNLSLQVWQLQPVHNVFLLILNELGVIALIGFIYLLFKLFHLPEMTVVKKTSDSIDSTQKLFHVEQFEISSQAGVEQLQNNVTILHLKSALISFTFIMLFDHYFWDLQQGQIMLWAILGLFFIKHRP